MFFHINRHQIELKPIPRAEAVKKSTLLKNRKHYPFASKQLKLTCHNDTKAFVFD